MAGREFIAAGIDPGSQILGFCALRVKGMGIPEPLEILDRKLVGRDKMEKILEAGDLVDRWLRKLGVVAIAAVEGGYISHDPKFLHSSFTLAEYRGAILFAARRVVADVREPHTRTVRCAIGLGKQEKRDVVNRQVQERVTMMLRLKAVPQVDAANACAIAMWAAGEIARPSAVPF